MQIEPRPHGRKSVFVTMATVEMENHVKKSSLVVTPWIIVINMPAVFINQWKMDTDANVTQQG